MQDNDLPNKNLSSHLSDKMLDNPEEDVNFLLQASQSLWNESSIKGLIKKFLILLQEHFELEEFGVFSPTPDGKKIDFKSHSMRFPNLQRFPEDILTKIQNTLQTLPLKNDDYRDGINTIFCENKAINFSIMGDQSTDSSKWYILTWTVKDKPEVLRLTLSNKARFQLDFLVRQLQSECRWVSKLDKTQALLYRDDLTGLFNYRYLDLALDSEIRRAQRFQTSFSLLFLDLDDFKLVNDRYGHLIGSSLLKKVAETLAGTLREVDTVIRYGGDEYLIIVLGANSRRGFLTAERIRSALEKTTFKFEDNIELKITTSIGVAAFPEHGMDKETLIRMSDEMMYSSKRGGKNRVTLVGVEPKSNDKTNSLF